MAFESAWIFGSVIIVSLLSLIGIFTLFFHAKKSSNWMIYVVGFAAGTMLGAAFLDLLPEAMEIISINFSLLFVLSGIAGFFVIEKFLHWHHYHTCSAGHCATHPVAYLNLIGDAIHNFIDGMIIASSYLLSVPAGIATTIAVIAHEIPQEIGDFGILLYAGFSKKKALFSNFLSALTAILGAAIVLFISAKISGVAAGLASFAAGGFIYMATADLLPQINKERVLSKSFIQFMLFLAGIVLILLLSAAFVE